MPSRTTWIGWAALGLLLAAPRLARLAYPQVWIEDDAYVHGAFLLSRGLMPYRDFPLPHLPLLEAMLAALFRIAPATVRTAELFTASASFAASLLVFAVGRRLGGSPTGVAAAVVFATSGLLFRYHLFEREVFLLVPVLAAVLLLERAPDGRGASPSGEGPARALAAGALLATALAIKLTAIASCAAIVVSLMLDGRRRSAVTVAAAAIGIVAALVVGLWVWFGADFVVQVFLFRAVHASFPALGVKLDEMRYTLDVSLAFGAAGVALIAWRRETRRWNAPLTQLATGFVVLVLLNPTYWAHTGIELLPWLSVPAGYLLATAARGRAAAATCLAGGIVLLLTVVPVRNLNWEAGDDSVHGFGYRDRVELENMGRFVREHSAPDALVATPPILAFIANRQEAIPYAEVAGTVDRLMADVRRDGYWSAFRSDGAREEPFWESVAASRDRLVPRLEAALAAHRVAVVIDDSPDDLVAVPLVNVTQETLERTGYTLEKVTPHYEAWIPTSRGSGLDSQR